ncbi:hypothetical protein [Enterobacter kobei]|uniref:hypothetical protein n=1 Tax=Enterobacter kobei TaxID=208224 RepID=UPI000642EB5C|nr:hypothetical protein [Enterobacter kobei]KLQ92821.1 hypothetical protein ABR29_03185 [Enterobacter kobei]KUP99662.1 hypothetical protein AWI05_06010 [Enterobacter kobei]
MSKRESRAASGMIELDYEWEESSSGHVETEQRIVLSGEGDYVFLKEFYSTKNFIKNNESSSSNITYKIPITLLISIIKKHGKI